jgi:hypothetical protein
LDHFIFVFFVELFLMDPVMRLMDLVSEVRGTVVE